MTLNKACEKYLTIYKQLARLINYYEIVVHCAKSKPNVT